MKSVELFSGAGGLALGLELSGCRHEALVEFNSSACRTIRYNINRGQRLVKNWTLYEGDVRDISFKKIVDGVELVAGGPPCQPFSLGGKAKGMSDVRDMFPEAVRSVRELMPRCFIFENVKGLLRKGFATYFNYVILQLSYPSLVRRNSETWMDHLARLERVRTSGYKQSLEYNVVYRLLDAADYGIPQHRHRVFIVGFRSDLGVEWNFPMATHSEDRLLWDKWITGDYWREHGISLKKRPLLSADAKARVLSLEHLFKDKPPQSSRYKTVRDAITDLPDPQERNNVPNHEFRGGARMYKGHTGSLLDEPSKALKAGAHGVPGGENMIVFPDGKCRYYTAREAARIQTFPDDYIFASSWTESMRQIGNAVPVQLAEIVGRSVLAQGELK